MQFVRSGQANLITADLNDGTNPITTGVVTHYLKALSGAAAGQWWDGAEAAWSATEAAAGTGAHDGRGHWTCSVIAEAWTGGVRYQTYAAHADARQINYRDEVLCLTSGGTWPEAAGDWPVSVSELKAHCRIDADETEEDALLAGYLAAATGWAEMYNGRKFLSQSCVDTLDAFGGTIQPRFAPLVSVESIVYLDSNGDEQTLDAAAYRVAIGSTVGRITPAFGTSWPGTQAVTGAVTVTYTAGYGTEATDVPAIYRHAILMIAASLYENREETSPLTIHQIPFGAKALLGIDRLVPV